MKRFVNDEWVEVSPKDIKKNDIYKTDKGTFVALVNFGDEPECCHTSSFIVEDGLPVISMNVLTASLFVQYGYVRSLLILPSDMLSVLMDKFCFDNFELENIHEKTKYEGKRGDVENYILMLDDVIPTGRFS